MKFLALSLAAVTLFLTACTPKPADNPASPDASESAAKMATPESSVAPSSSNTSGDTNSSPVVAPDSTGASTVSFKDDIQPLLSSNCTSCHGGSQPKLGMSLESYDSLMQGGEYGPPVKPGYGSESLIVMAMNGNGVKQMPPSGQLSKDKIEMMKTWITEGAKNN